MTRIIRVTVKLLSQLIKKWKYIGMAAYYHKRQTSIVGTTVTSRHPHNFDICVQLFISNFMKDVHVYRDV